MPCRQLTMGSLSVQQSQHRPAGVINGRTPGIMLSVMTAHR